MLVFRAMYFTAVFRFDIIFGRELLERIIVVLVEKIEQRNHRDIESRSLLRVVAEYFALLENGDFRFPSGHLVLVAKLTRFGVKITVDLKMLLSVVGS